MTSRLVLGEGERDFGQGGRGDPPVEDPSGDGRSIEGEGEGEGVNDLGEGAGSELLEDLGVEGRDSPGDIEVGLASKFVVGFVDSAG